jgi:hypothetical protein
VGLAALGALPLVGALVALSVGVGIDLDAWTVGECL